MAPWLLLDFLRASDPVAIAKAKIIKNMLMDHPYYRPPFPEGVLAPEQLGELNDRMQFTYDESKSHDVLKVKMRKATRTEFNKAYRKTALHLEIATDGDPAKLEHTGFDVRRVSKKPPAPPAHLGPPKVVVTHGKVSTVIMAHIVSLAGAAIYDLYITSGDPSQEENWGKYGSFVHASKIEITGRTPGQLYWIKARGIGAAGPGAFSAPVPLMSL